MTGPGLSGPALRHALSRQAYATGVIRVAARDLAGCDCLVATRNGLYAASRRGVRRLLWGCFFGLCRQDDVLFLFESCDHPARGCRTGRLLRVKLRGGRLAGETVLAAGLSNRCHQIAMVDELLCVVDTEHQAVRRFRPDDGAPVDVVCPVPDDGPDGYRHMNSIAAVGDRIGLLLHNGPLRPPRSSEVVWLDRDWRVIGRHALPGHHCHDILGSPDGTVWHCGSAAGEVVAADGRRIALTDRMTRGLIALGDGFVVGTSLLGERAVRDALPGSLLYLDRDFRQLAEVECPGAPTQLLALA